MAEIELSPRELRRIRLRERHPWLLPAMLVLLWLVTLGDVGFGATVIVRHGASVGLTGLGDVWHLAMSWRYSHRLFEPFEVFVIEWAGSAIRDLGALLVFTCIVIVAHSEAGLVLKLWHALQERRSE